MSNTPPVRNAVRTVVPTAEPDESRPARQTDPVLATVRRIARAAGSGKPAEYQYALVAREARALTGAGATAIALRSEAAANFIVATAEGDRARLLRGQPLAADDPLARAALRSGKPAIVAADRRGGCAVGLPPGDGVVAPIVLSGRVAGALFGVYPAGALLEDAAQTLGAFAEQTASIIALADARRDSEEQTRELAAFHSTLGAVGGCLAAADILGGALETVAAHLPQLRDAAVFLLNDDRTHLFIAADRGLTDEDREVQLAADGRLTAQALESPAPIIIADAQQEPDLDAVQMQDRPAACSAVAAAIRGHGETLGLLLVTAAEPDAFSPADARVAQAVGAQMGAALCASARHEELQRRAEETVALNDLSQHVSATLHMDRVCQFVADSVVSLLRVDKFALMLMDPRDERLVTQVSRGVDVERFRRFTPQAGEGIPGWVYDWMTPQAISDVAADARSGSCPLHQEGIASLICVPMAVGAEVVGVVLAMSSRRRFFTVAEMELLYTIGNQAAVAIANARLYQDARSKSVEVRRYFHRVARALGSALEAQDLPQLLADLAIEMLRADRCAIYRVDGADLRLHATSHFRHTTPPDAVLPLGEGLAGWVARRGRAAVVEDLAADPRSRAYGWLARDPLASYIGVALKTGRKTVGVLELYTQEPRTFSPEEVKLLTQFVRRARIAERLALESA